VNEGCGSGSDADKAKVKVVEEYHILTINSIKTLGVSRKPLKYINHEKDSSLMGLRN